MSAHDKAIKAGADALFNWRDPQGVMSFGIYRALLQARAVIAAYEAEKAKGAADEIERLCARVAKLEEAIKPFAKALDNHDRHAASGRGGLAPSNWTNYDDWRQLRAALEQKP